MIQATQSLAIPVRVTTRKDGCDLYIPDLLMTIHDKDYTAVVASAIARVQAIYTYNKERNMPISFKATYQEVSDTCVDNASFPTYLTIKGVE